MLLLACGLMMLVRATATHLCEGDLAVRRRVAAVSFITPYSAPPAGKETPVNGKVVLMQPGFRGMHVRTKGINNIIMALIGYIEQLDMGVSNRRPTNNSIHGFHIHEYGDTVSAGCQSTGGHYNPFDRQHGAPSNRFKRRHVGDLGNVRADHNGVVNVVLQDNLISLSGPNSVIGRAFVIHQNEDDLGRGTGDARAGSQRTGNAGARLGCGVIARAPLSVASSM